MKKIILILIVIFVSCNKPNRLKKHENKIKETLINQKTKSLTLSLDTISSFQWDELLIAGPYTDLNKISNYHLNGIPNTIKNYDNFILLVFLNKKKGIKYINIDRSLIQNDIIDGYKIFSKDNSNIIIRK